MTQAADSQQALALSIVKAVQEGLPGADSADAIHRSVKEALTTEARKNELLLAYVRTVLVASVVVASAVSHLRPGLIGEDLSPSLPTTIVLGLWLATSVVLVALLARGWYKRELRRLVPVYDAASIAVAYIFTELQLSEAGAVVVPGPYLIAAAACSLLAFSGALRLSRSSARIATLVALAAWTCIWFVGSVPVAAAAVTAGAILSIGYFAGRITRVIRNIVTDEVTRVRLVQLYEQAQQAISAREEVLRIVSHDLRNPIGTISMATDLLLEEAVTDEERARYLGIIRRQGESMEHLVSDLLDAARVESGKLPIDFERVSVDRLVGGALEMMQPHAADKRIELVALQEPDFPYVWVDPDRIDQVFSNLIGNAIKFTPQGGRITVSGSQVGEKVRFAVADTGPGIPAEQLNSIFGRMWQARKDDSRGIGLGLTIARAIVEAHGERMGVESRLGEGTEFWFTVPLAPVVDAARRSSSDAA